MASRLPRRAWARGRGRLLGGDRGWACEWRGGSQRRGGAVSVWARLRPAALHARAGYCQASVMEAVRFLVSPQDGQCGAPGPAPAGTSAARDPQASGPAPLRASSASLLLEEYRRLPSAAGPRGQRRLPAALQSFVAWRQASREQPAAGPWLCSAARPSSPERQRPGLLCALMLPLGLGVSDSLGIGVVPTPTVPQSPFYGEDFYCEIPRSFRHLSFYIFDRDVFRRDSIIGKVAIQKEDLQKYHNRDTWFQLQHVDADSEVQGKVHLELRLSEVITDSGAICHKLAVRILECQGLPIVNGQCDPYATVTLAGPYRSEAKKTKVKKKTNNPHFDEVFYFEVTRPCSYSRKSHFDCEEEDVDKLELRVDLWSASNLKLGDEFLGELRVPLNVLGQSSSYEAWYFLQPRDSGGKNLKPGDLGSLRLNVVYTEDHVFTSDYYSALRGLLLKSADVEVRLPAPAAPQARAPPCRPELRPHRPRASPRRPAGPGLLPAAPRAQLRPGVTATPPQPVSASAAHVLGEVCKEKQEAAVPLVRLFLHYGRVVPFISAIASAEVRRTHWRFPGLGQQHRPGPVGRAAPATPDRRRARGGAAVECLARALAPDVGLRTRPWTRRPLSRDPNTIFRGNSLTSKCIDETMKLAGMQYLHLTLKPAIEEIIHSHKSCEIDPVKLKDGENLESNMENLRQHVDRVFSAITKSGVSCPTVMCDIFFSLREAAAKRFQDDLDVRYTAVSGFIFLRFFAPAILSPNLFQLTPHHTDPQVSRTLTLISKTIQTLGSLSKSKSPAGAVSAEGPATSTAERGVPLQASFKESYMAAFYEFFNEQQYADAVKEASVHLATATSCLRTQTPFKVRVAGLEGALRRSGQAPFLDLISSSGRRDPKSVEQPILLKEGFMVKRAQGRKRFGMKNFKKRWFRLTNHEFTYQKSKGDAPLYSIPIENILAVEKLEEESFKMKNVSGCPRRPPCVSWPSLGRSLRSLGAWTELSSLAARPRRQTPAPHCQLLFCAAPACSWRPWAAPQLAGPELLGGVLASPAWAPTTSPVPAGVTALTRRRQLCGDCGQDRALGSEPSGLPVPTSPSLGRTLLGLCRGPSLG
ncbi:Ras GTPase-activating protein 3 [Galemys pyrenaicus]|uniref:Ras GTPase-activating protein 3 n=1 Tax=Galemys pyrenaicus TaxID=202257 RepID=A0A8J5ZR09_GALPY|nr:Ras GTPase-activating protein 3 [Galemys pyrenaicus]